MHTASIDFEYCIIGGGVIGLALAYQLSQTSSDVLLIERNALFGTETSSRNSEVIHAGFYYPPSTLKEALCIRGKQLIYQFCQDFEVPHRQIGKLLVSSKSEDPKLQELAGKAKKLNIPLEWLDETALKQREPDVHARQALYSATTGIIDSHTFIQRLAQLSQQRGACLVCQTQLFQAEPKDSYWQLHCHTEDGDYTVKSRYVVNAAGLNAQQVAQQMGMNQDKIPKLYPCRGHYFSYQGKAPFQHLIYPVPDDNLVGLGIHATLDLSNQVRFGPDVEYLDTNSSLNYDVNENLKADFASAIQRYFPAIDINRMQADYAGIRPKLHQAHQPAHDFMFVRTGKPYCCHLFGIESPGLTASLAIAEHTHSLLTNLP